jgi:hypothetical protein
VCVFVGGGEGGVCVCAFMYVCACASLCVCIFSLYMCVCVCACVCACVQFSLYLSTVSIHFSLSLSLHVCVVICGCTQARQTHFLQACLQNTLWSVAQDVNVDVRRSCVHAYHCHLFVPFFSFVDVGKTKELYLEPLAGILRHPSTCQVRATTRCGAHNLLCYNVFRIYL